MATRQTRVIRQKRADGALRNAGDTPTQRQGAGDDKDWRFTIFTSGARTNGLDGSSRRCAPAEHRRQPSCWDVIPVGAGERARGL